MKKATEKMIEKAAGEVRGDATRAVLGLETKIKSALQEVRLAQAKGEAGLETEMAKTEAMEKTLSIVQSTMETQEGAKATAEALSQKMTEDIEKSTKEILDFQAKALAAFEAEHLKVPGLIGKGPMDLYLNVPAYLRAMHEKRFTDLDNSQKSLAAAVAELDAQIREEAADALERGNLYADKLGRELTLEMAESQERVEKAAQELAAETARRMDDVR